MVMPSRGPSRGPSPLRPGFPFNGTSSYKVTTPMSPADQQVHPVLSPGRVAVITGAASGIGRAAAHELAQIGMKLALADLNGDGLQEAGKETAAVVGDANVLVIPTDVSQLDQVTRLKDKVYEAWGEVAVLMNNAGVGLRGNSWEGIENWKKIFDVNVFGVVNVQQTFVPAMLCQENQAIIINTGSKQGITNPPGNAAYNASKAAIKSLTESLAHELRERPSSNTTAHLFVPGWTWTGMTGKSGAAEKPDGAWTAQETVLYMLDAVRRGEFYILCPDNDTRRELDQLRIMWGAADAAEGRPALSRWEKHHKALFEEYIRDGLASFD